jgi:hypothetical protein
MEVFIIAPSRNCDIEGCTNGYKKTVSREKAGTSIKDAGLSLSIKDKITRVHLCPDHYRIIKKKLKKDRKLESLRWGK